MSGETETAVSLMRLAETMDSGPVFAQQKVQLSGTETKQELADKLSLIGSQLIRDSLPSILDGSLQPIPQNESAASYDDQIQKADGIIDWSKPAARLEREVRAYAGWPRSRASLGSSDVIVTRAHAESGQGQPGNLRIENKQLGVFTADGLLIIDSLIPSGKPEMSASAFLAGYKLS